LRQSIAYSAPWRPSLYKTTAPSYSDSI
jgi:hypothetical protein